VAKPPAKPPEEPNISGFKSLGPWISGFRVFSNSFFREEFSAIVDEPPTDFFSFQLYIYIQANTGDLHLGLKDVIDACSSFFSRTCHATLFH